jgi:hypothetical protein
MERSSEFFSRLIVFGLFTRVNQMAYRMTGSLQRCQYRDVNTEQMNLWDHGSRPGGDAPSSPRKSAGDSNPPEDISRRQRDVRGRRYGSLSSMECTPYRNFTSSECAA